MTFLYNVFNMLLSLFGSILILRAYLWRLAISPRDPLVRFAWKFTDWLVNPIAYVVKPHGDWDWSTIAAAFLTALVDAIVMREALGVPATPSAMLITPVALVLRWTIDLAVWGIIIYCVMSFLNKGRSVYMALLGTLCDPLLRPFRRMIPTFRGFDLSPMVVIVLLNVLLMVIGPASMGLVSI